MTKTRLCVLCILLILLALLAGQQIGQAQYAPGGQKVEGATPGGAINQGTFDAGSPKAGYSYNSITPSLRIDPSSTAQATFSTNGNLLTGTVIRTHLTIITACPAGAGVTLPAITQSMDIVIMNRSGSSCNIWPSLGATIQLAGGATSAVNAPFPMPSMGDYGFRAQSATAWFW